jgi:hypothetical protein
MAGNNLLRCWRSPCLQADVDNRRRLSVNAVAVLIVILLVLVVLPLPMYLIATRRGIPNAWVAFIPIVGYSIVWLWAMSRSGWMMLIGFIPLVNIVFSIWLCFGMPPHHGRTRWWGVALLFLPWIGALIYALTLDRHSQPAAALS